VVPFIQAVRSTNIYEVIPLILPFLYRCGRFTHNFTIQPNTDLGGNDFIQMILSEDATDLVMVVFGGNFL
jgi:hypothetical protein